jgi:hypothetical protein
MERFVRVRNYSMAVVGGFEAIRGTFSTLEIYINMIVFYICVYKSTV